MKKPLQKYSQAEAIVAISITIIDGYIEGDKLTLTNHQNILSYSWDNNSRVLSLNIVGDKNIKNIISSVLLEGVSPTKSRLLEVATSMEQNNYVLQEYSIYPTFDFILEENKDIFFGKYHEELDLSLNLPNITYIDVKGADFFNVDMVETFPYFLNKSNDSDVYTILTNDLSADHNIEIWGYNLSQDKIDLNNFGEDLRGLYYQILENQDLQLSVYNSAHEYSIILKEVASRNDADTLDELIETLVFKIDVNKSSL